MMGPRQEAQAALFHEFSLEDHVPQDHLSIDRHLDLSSIRGHLADFHSHTGRPSIDPELLIRMLPVGGQGFAADASLIVADVRKQRSGNPEDWKDRAVKTEDAPRAVREYIDAPDDAAFGAASETTPGLTAHADPASQWTAARKGPAFLAYSDNYPIDTDHGIIVDVDASRSIRQAEVGAMRKMIDRTEDRFGLKPDRMAADTAYGSSENLVWLTLKRRILPFIPVFDHSRRKDGTWSRSDFTRDKDNDRYICPEGKELRHTRRSYSDPSRHKPKPGRRQYRSLKLDCQGCPSKPRCCPNTATRSINREEYGIVRDFARQCTASEFNPTAQRRRKKSKCHSRIPNASSGQADSDYEGHVASRTDLPSQLPPRTSGNWQNSSRQCLPQGRKAA